MNKYYIQADMGISQTVRAKSAENAKKNFLNRMERDYPDEFEFIRDNISVTCIYVDPNDTHDGEEEGWVDEKDRVVPSYDDVLLAESERKLKKQGLRGLARSYDEEDKR